MGAQGSMKDLRVLPVPTGPWIPVYRTKLSPTVYSKVLLCRQHICTDISKIQQLNPWQTYRRLTEIKDPIILKLLPLQTFFCMIPTAEFHCSDLHHVTMYAGWHLSTFRLEFKINIISCLLSDICKHWLKEYNNCM